MLEVKWKDNYYYSGFFQFECFNPCYVGSKMERKAPNDAVDEVILFQSLLCWK